MLVKSLRDLLDLEDFVHTHFDVVPASDGEELRVCCPSCQEEDYKCYVNARKKLFHCFKCTFSSRTYDLVDFVASTLDTSRAQAVTFIETTYFNVADSFESIEQKVKEAFEKKVPSLTKPKIKYLSALPQECKPLDDPFNPHQLDFWVYLLNRGLTEAEIRQLKCHWVGESYMPVYNESGTYKGNIGRRVVIPIYHEGQLISWLARSIANKNPKYLNAPESDLSKTVWPFVPPKHHMVLVEGVIDAVSVRRADYSAYATFGKHLSPPQIEAIKGWSKEVTLFWDKKDAYKEMLRAIQSLKLHFSDVFVPDLSSWPDNVDAGDLLKDENGSKIIRKCLDSKISVHSLDFILWQNNF